MYWINGNTGDIITGFDSMGKTEDLTGEEHKFKVEYGKNVLRELIGYKNIITIHNHPNSTAPSAGDYNSAYKNGYTMGFTVSHDGRVFKYTSRELISETVYNAYWNRFVCDGYNYIDAQLLAIKRMSENAKISIAEVIKNDLV
jgi:hypothetical protein